MPKITIRDTFKEFHTYTGDVFAVEQDGGCKVFERLPDGKNKMLQSFGAHIFGWLKIEGEKYPVQTDSFPVKQDMDPYTQAGLSQIDPSDRPSIAPRAYDINKDDLPVIEGERYVDAPMVDGSTITLTPAGQKAVDEIKAEKPKRVRPSRAKAQEEGTIDRAAATMAAAQEAGLLPNNQKSLLGKPLAPEAPPSLDDLKAKGLLKPASAIVETQERDQQADPYCDTCKGRGTIQDPESEDPLDTTVCPDC